MKKFAFKKTFKSVKQVADIYNILSHTDIHLNKPVVNEVVFPLTQTIENQVDKLIDTLRLDNGVYKRRGAAIASNQVGLDLRFFLMADYNANPHDIQKRIETICNPRILDSSKETNEDDEGCLSIPEYIALVNRHDSILVEYQNILGNKVKKELHGFKARVFQHELDHLDGIHMLKRAIKIETNPLYLEYLEKHKQSQQSSLEEIGKLDEKIN